MNTILELLHIITRQFDFIGAPQKMKLVLSKQSIENILKVAKRNNNNSIELDGYTIELIEKKKKNEN